MSRHNSVLAGMATCVALGLVLSAGLSGCASSMNGPGRTNHKITVSVGEGGIPVVEPDTVTAKEGDKIHWVFKGAEAKEFGVRFKSVANSPFDWSEKKALEVKGKVKNGAATGCADPGCKYSVDVEGKARDPRIIIEP